MRKVSAILVCGACSVAAGQQAQVQYTWEWSEVLAGTATPSSATPGVIDPTEGVRLTLHATFTPNVGQTVVFSHPGGPGPGTVRSWGLTYAVLRGGAGTAGAFSPPVCASGFENFNYDVLSPGVISFDAAHEWYNTAGVVPSTASPVQGLISFTWTPASYTPRTVSFVSEDVISAGAPNQLIAQYGVGPTGNPLLWFAGAQPNHGPGTGAIPIVPGPGSLVALLAGAGVLAGPRRRGRA